jgi:hypothetical protein
VDDWDSESARLAARALADGPWPFSQAEITSFADRGLDPVRIEQLDDGIRRWRAEFSDARIRT